MQRCACCCSRVGAPLTASQYTKQNVCNTYLIKKKGSLLVFVLLPNIGQQNAPPAPRVEK